MRINSLDAGVTLRAMPSNRNIMVNYHLIDAQELKLQLAAERSFLIYIAAQLVQYVSRNPDSNTRSIRAEPNASNGLALLDIFMDSFPELLDVTQKGIKLVRGRFLYGMVGFEMNVIDNSEDQTTVIVIADPGSLGRMMQELARTNGITNMENLSLKLSGMSLRVDF